MATAAWTTLPSAITPSIWQSLNHYLAPELRALGAEAGIRYRISGQAVMVRLAPVPDDLVYIRPLQAVDGQLRRDVHDILVRDTVEIDLPRTCGRACWRNAHRANFR